MLSLGCPSGVSALVITEVHYHPHPLRDSEQALEFVELYNDNSIREELSGCFFAEGIGFRFPENFFLAARSYVVVVSNETAFRAVYELDETVPVLGDFSGRLDNGGERLRVVTPAGRTLAELRYRDRNDWPAGADATGFTLALRDVLADPSRPESWTHSAESGGTPGRPNFAADEDEPSTELLARGSVWRLRTSWDALAQEIVEYSDPPAAWSEDDFDASSWLEAATPIGYGKEAIVTVLEDMRSNYTSFAIRRDVLVEEGDLEHVRAFVLRLWLDDGAVVFVNGEEVSRIGLPGASGERVESSAIATRSSRFEVPIEVLLRVDKFRVGRNSIAIQVHNVSVQSSDVAVDVSLTLERLFAAQENRVQLAFNEMVSVGLEDELGLELVNTSSAEFDLSGHVVTDSVLRAEPFVFPPGSLVPAHGRIAVRSSDLGFAIGHERATLLLLGVDRESIVNAVSLRVPALDDVETISLSRFPDGAGPWVVSETPTLDAPNQAAIEEDLVINEINYNPLIVDEQNRPDSRLASGRVRRTLQSIRESEYSARRHRIRCRDHL